MRTGKVLVIATTAMALALIGHGALDAFADSKAEDLIDQLRERLPEGSELSYKTLDGDPYNTGVTIDNLVVDHPAYGKASIGTVTLSDAEVDDDGKLSSLGEVQLDNLRLQAERPGKLAIRSANIKNLAGDGLEALLKSGFSSQAISSLDFDALKAEAIELTMDDGTAAVSQLEIDNAGTKAARLHITDSQVVVPSQGTQLGFESLTWTGPLTRIVDNGENAQEFLDRLPASFNVANAVMNSQGGLVSLGKLSTDIERDGASAFIMNYRVDDASINGLELPSGIGHALSLTGTTRHNLETLITEAEFRTEGDGLGKADVAFKVRGLDAMAGAQEHGNVVPTVPPAILAASVDYTDAGMARAFLDELAESFGTTREGVVNMGIGLASTMLGEGMSPALTTIFDETRSFAREPNRLQIELNPQNPIDPSQIMIMGLMNPSNLPQALGLTVLANR